MYLSDRIVKAFPSGRPCLSFVQITNYSTDRESWQVTTVITYFFRFNISDERALLFSFSSFFFFFFLLPYEHLRDTFTPRTLNSHSFHWWYRLKGDGENSTRVNPSFEELELTSTVKRTSYFHSWIMARVADGSKSLTLALAAFRASGSCVSDTRDDRH